MGNYDDIVVAGGDTSTPLNIKKRLTIISKYITQSSKVLDGGCGSGTYVRILREEFRVDVVGIEYLAEKVTVAHNNPALIGIVNHGDIQNISYNESTFDVVLLNEVLEHVPDEQQALREIHRVLNKDGTLILFCPNRLYPFETHGVYLKGSNYKLPPYIPFIPYIPLYLGKLFFNYWARNYWPSELKRLCIKSGFEIVNTDFIWQTFENISGQQPWFIRSFCSRLRLLANWCEQIPLLKLFGASQVLVLRKKTN